MGGGTLARGAACALAVLATLPAAAPAIPAEGPREVVDVLLTTTRPGAPTGVTYRSYIRHPTDPAAEPIPLRRLIVGLPEGGTVDTTLPEMCTASDEELRQQGDDVCPRGSLVGFGSAEVAVTGLGHQHFDARAYNNEGQQVEVVKQGDMVTAVIRGFFTPEGLDALIPTCVTGGQPPSGCPFDQARLVRSELVVPEYTVGDRTYFRTSPTCPPSGRWRTPVILTYADGVTERVYPEQPCEPSGGATGGAGTTAGSERPASACRSRRRIHLAGLARRRLRSISAVLRGRRVRLDPRRPVLDLRGLPRGRYTVRIRAVTRGGRTLRVVRRYRTCTG
jgi:hypothetical protein